MIFLQKVLITLVLMYAVILPLVSEDENRIIDNPAPTMEEKNYIPLVKVKEISEELSDDQFLFSPFSFTADYKNNLYIYDRAQSKIIKLDNDGNYVKSFGRWGEGPGEFMGKGRTHMCFLKIGNDNLLYANDMVGHKIMAYTLDGKYLRSYKYKALKSLHPIVDSNGNVLTHKSENGLFTILNEKERVFFTYHTLEKKIDYIFRKPKDNRPEFIRIKFPRQPYLIDSTHMQMDLIGETLVVLFHYSATLYVAKDKKNIKQIKIWPKDALRDNKKQNLTKQNGKFGKHKSMFTFIFRDGDGPHNLYLQYGVNKERGLNCLYKVNLDGKLLGVMYIEAGEDFASFRLKQNGLYYAKQDDRIVVYKEDSK